MCPSLLPQPLCLSLPTAKAGARDTVVEIIDISTTCGIEQKAAG